ncbi:MAG: hypothetical protein QME51_05350, partial [Planctomycetota bacterium]|nr:hypothetical protein [Planctomycetota bacterium]
MTTYIVYSDIYLKHDTGPHPENSRRLELTVSYLKKKNWDKKAIWLEPRPTDVDEIAYVHNKNYIESVKRMAEEGGGYLDPDTPVSSHSYEVALYAAGGLLTAVDKIMEVNQENQKFAIRPEIIAAQQGARSASPLRSRLSEARAETRREPRLRRGTSLRLRNPQFSNALCLVRPP